VKRPFLLAVAACLYLVAAWTVAPGFYDGFTPPQPYNWTTPPPQAAAGNLQPRSGHLDIKVIGGVSDANSAFTDDGQVVIGFLPGAFDATGKTTISVDIKPESAFPPPGGLHFATNVYLITADAPPVKAINLVLRYSDLVPAPSHVYLATDPNGSWTDIGASAESQPFTVQTTTKQLGYVAAGYPSGATSSSSSPASRLLPIAVAVLIVGVLVAGIPLAMIRRRRESAAVEDDGDEAEA
jgi:hypothetical protein